MNNNNNFFKTAESEKIIHLDYFNMAVSVDCVIFGYEGKDLKVLLIRSDLKEFKGLYSLPGDLVHPVEDLESASCRILKEKTGLDDVYLEQVQTFGSVGRHPSGRVVTTAYFSLLDIEHHQLQITQNDLHWHKVSELKTLAFDHQLILETCKQRLRSQVMEKPIVFNLLPSKFSLRKLQEVYEAILGTNLDRRNFRKKIALKKWLEDIDEMENNVPHRPGKLYSFKTNHKKNPSGKRGSVNHLPLKKRIKFFDK